MSTTTKKGKEKNYVSFYSLLKTNYSPYDYENVNIVSYVTESDENEKKTICFNLCRIGILF